MTTSTSTQKVSSAFDFDEIELGEVDLIHGVYEVERKDSDLNFPPAMGRTRPPCVSWLILRGTDGPFGPFRLAQTRMTCMLGILKRLYIIESVTDNSELARALEEKLGIVSVEGQIDTSIHVDRVTASVSVVGMQKLAFLIDSPVILPTVAVPLLPTVHMADTDVGQRLVDMDVLQEALPTEAVHRGQLKIDHVEWPTPVPLVPTFPITGFHVRLKLSLTRPSAMFDPEVAMGQGRTYVTERV